MTAYLALGWCRRAVAPAQPRPATGGGIHGPFVALSGTTYAAVNLPNRSVTRKKIARKTIAAVNLKTNSVTARAIRRNAVRGSKVLESSLGRVPLAADSATLGGRSLEQVRAGIDAAALGGVPRSGFYSASDVDARLPRASETPVSTDAFSAASPLDRITVQLTAPRAGFAFVVASGNVRPSGTLPAGHQCAVQMSVPGDSAGRPGSSASRPATRASTSRAWRTPGSCPWTRERAPSRSAYPSTRTSARTALTRLRRARRL